MSDILLDVQNLQYLHKTALGRYFHKTPKGMKKFGVEDISFQIKKGYIYGLVGMNGCGKTTLMNTLVRGDYGRGRVLFDGYDMAENRLKARDNIGIITQPALLLENKSAYENGKIFGELYTDWNEEAYLKKLEEFEVDKDVELKKLSRGNVMRVLAAFAWGHRAKLLIADEPTAGFDPLFRKDFLRFLQEYVEDGEHSVIMSTHLTEDLDKIADYLMIMCERRIVFDDDMLSLKDWGMTVKDLMIKLSRKAGGNHGESEKSI